MLRTILNTLYVNSFNPHHNCMTEVLLFTPFFRWTERVFNLPAVTQLVYLFSIAALQITTSFITLLSQSFVGQESGDSYDFSLWSHKAAMEVSSRVRISSESFLNTRGYRQNSFPCSCGTHGGWVFNASRRVVPSLKGLTWSRLAHPEEYPLRLT